MGAVLVVVTSLGLVFGSLIAAAFLCWFLWQIFALIHRPNWAFSGILVLVVLALTGRLPNSQFLHLALAYAFAAAAPLWIGGAASRRNQIATGTDKPRSITTGRQ